MSAGSPARRLALGAALVAALVLVSSSLVAAAPLLSSPAHGATSGGPQWGHRSPVYPLRFNETGLPNGTEWTVTLVGPAADGRTFSACSNTSGVSFSVPNGTYAFSIPDAVNGSSVYAASPVDGSVVINGSAASVALTFSAVPLTLVTFGETGLPAGTFWSVELAIAENGSFGPGPTPLCYGTSYWNGTNNSTLAFEVPGGNYSYSIGNVSNGSREYVPTPASGNLTANGTAVTVDVEFAALALYNLSFVESGLPSGTPWYVVLSGAGVGWTYNATTNSSLDFAVPNGTYFYEVGTAGWGPLSPAAIPFCGNGSGNGSAPGGYFATPSSGNVTVNGTDVQVDVVFAPLVYRTVTFAETGLPNGTFFQVDLYGSGANSTGWGGGWWGGSGWGGSANGTLVFTVLPGEYGFYVPAVFVNGTEYVAAPGNGTVSVNGTNVTVDLSFARVSLYTLAFTETGLPNGTFWSVVVQGSGIGSEFAGSRGATISFEVPNGTYAFRVLDPSSYPVAPFCANGSRGGAPGEVVVASPSNGTVTVAGANASVAIAFSYAALYAVSFTETGLPNGTIWFVVGPVLGHAGGPWTPSAAPAWGIGPNGSAPPAAVVFWLPNGSYQFEVLNATAPNGTLYSPTPATVTVTVAGANVSVAISFSDPPAGGTHAAPSAQGPAAALGPVPRAMVVDVAVVGAAIVGALAAALLLLRRRPRAPAPVTAAGEPKP